MTTPTLKEMKGKIDGNELDLSMSSLEIVPVKELAQLRKATILDLSCNRFESLPDEFCRLEHLTKLDLSQNQLMSLPENFGRLVNLEKLDLYKNQLEVLPLSMFRLKKLKWLDVKDNPLSPVLAKVAGDCLDTKQCQMAASKVIRHLQQIQAEQERERQNRLAIEREKEAARRKAEEEKKMQLAGAKKKEKGKKKGAKQQNGTQNGTMEARSDQTRFAERKNDTGKKMGAQKSGGDCLRIMCGVITGLILSFFTFLFFLAVATGLTAGLLYWNCSSRPEWIPASRELCNDLYHFSATGQAPKSMDSLYLVASGTSGAVKDGFDHFALYVRNADFAGLASDVTEKMSRTSGKVITWIQNDSGPFLQKARTDVQTVASWLFERAKVQLRVCMNFTLKSINQFLSSTRTVIENATK